MEKKKMGTAKALEKIARYSAKATVQTRCIVIGHQPKQPKNIKNFCK